RVLLHIQKRLVQLARAGKKVIFLIDEAQAMPRDTLEALRLLSNLETSKRKLLQIILLGQPELDQLLQRADLRQLSQRIAYQAQLSNLSECDAAAYLERRLAVAGAVRKLFAPAATKLLIARSGGNPRLLNVLGDKALMSAYAAGRNQVQRSDVLQALLDSSTALNHSSLDTEPKTMPLWAKAAALAAVVLMPGGFAWWS
ncbi:MAG: AAA family ATPase, partial [Cellvibrionaceae bacterium]|nr:AAA family ATPase [Cellvibrionaceae bacterium]